MESLRRCLLVGLLVGWTCATVSGQDDQRIGTKALTLPVKLVDGHLILGVTLYNPTGLSDAVSVELSLDTPNLMTLDGDQHGWLGIDEGAIRKGKDVSIRVDFAGGPTLLFPAKDVVAEKSAARGELHNRMTRLFSNQLDERKVKGMLGLAFLKSYNLILDLASKQLVLTPLGVPPTPAVNSIGADFSGRYELRDGRLTLPIGYPGLSSARMVIGSSNYDTLIEPAVAKRLGKPAGDLQPVMVLGTGLFDLAEFVALRPLALSLGDPAAAAAPVILSGVNLLESFRLEIDWGQARLRLIQQKPPQQLGADRAYFVAEMAGTPAAFQDFLKANPTSRLSAEAARRLIALRYDEWGVFDEELLQALQWVVDTSPPERRTENALVHVKKLAQLPGKTDLTIQAALMAIKHSRQAITVQDVYRLHRILGEQYLLQNNLDAAWKHLMSGAFITISRDPEHTFLVTLNLARVYDRQGRTIRAYSRYKAALAVAGAPMSAEVRKEITAAIERLKAKISPEQLQMLDS